MNAAATAPVALPVRAESIPSELQRRDRWLIWRYEPRDDHYTKVPYRSDGRSRASATDPGTWSPFAAAMATYRRGGYDGIGFALGDGVIGIDHDHAVDTVTGDLSPQANLWERLGAYRELSPSGTGVHDLVLGVLPDDPERRGWGRRSGPLEVYAGDRYLTVTGQRGGGIGGGPVDLPKASPVLAQLYRRSFPPTQADSPAPSPPTALQRGDADILALARRARNGARFDALWNGDTSAHGNDDSRADQALLSCLTFYTQDPGQLDRLFRASGLMRPKWERADYRDRTIARALDRSEHYQPSARVLTMPNGRPPAARRERLDQETGEVVGDDEPDAAESDQSGAMTPPAGKVSQATRAVQIALAHVNELWHATNGDPFATFTIAAHREHHAIKSAGFRDQLARWFWIAEGKSIGGQALQDALNTLGGMARFDGLEQATSGRIAHHDDAVWVDLGDADWRAIRISRDGYAVVESVDVPVRFRRSRSIRPLPIPEPGGSLEELRELFVIDDTSWLLLVGWLIGCFQPSGGRAHLELMGRQGSGKTTLLRWMLSVIDPAEVVLRAAPQDETSLVIAVQSRSTLGFDNLSGLSPDMADAICRLSTGGGLGRRQLFSDSEEILLAVQAPIAWTAISPLTTSRPDLADRTVSVTVSPLDDNQYASERSLDARFRDMRPRLFGATLSAVAAALEHRDSVGLETLPRLADFTEWVEAAGIGLGWPEGAFCDCMAVSRATASALAVDASPVGPLIVKLVSIEGEWRGTATDLLARLRLLADEDSKRARGFPRQPNHLSNALRRIQPALLHSGIGVGFGRDRNGSMVMIDRVETPETLAGALHRRVREAS